MKIDDQKFKEKGWTKREINKVNKISKEHEDVQKNTQIAVYWIIIFIMVILTLLISVWLVPFFLVLKGFNVFILLFLLGLCFGALFNNLIVHLEHLSKKHYVFAGIIIPLVAVASLFIIVQVSSWAAAKLGIAIVQNPVEVSSFYVLGFLLPYFYGILYKKR